MKQPVLSFYLTFFLGIFSIHNIGFCDTKGLSPDKKTRTLLAQISRDKTNISETFIGQVLQLSSTQRSIFLECLELPVANHLYNMVSRSSLFLKPEVRDAVNQLADSMGARNRPVKQMTLPPYETLFILDEQNADDFLKKEGMLYSELKYGKPEVIARFAEMIASRVRARFGEDMSQNPGDWVVASAAYYRSPNAASYLGEAVSVLLGLPLADIRTRGIFTGEFGSVDAPEKRCETVAGKKMYLSNPHLVSGKKVIYIDDVYVSGANLIEHESVLEDFGATKIFPYAIFDVASKNLTLEASLNYAFVSQHHPEPLLGIINSPETPVLTRTAKFILRLDQAGLTRFLEQLPDERVFEILETAEAEGYGDQEVFSNSFHKLMEEAQKRHNQHMRPLPDLFERDIRLIIADFDDTLAPEMTPLSDETMEHLCAFLDQGVSIAIVSLQPMTHGGLEQLVHQPLIRYLLRQKKSRSILRHLYLFANGGTVSYQYNDQGQLSLDKPVYNTGIPFTQEKAIEKIVLNTVGHLATKSIHRGAYTSIHFKNAVHLEKGIQMLKDALSEVPYASIFRTHTTTPGKYSIRVGQVDRPKIIAKSYIMKHLRQRISSRSDRPLLRSQILTAGDKMGYSQEENSDSDFFIFGGLNLALGKEARQGAYKTYLNLKSQGLNIWLKSYRREKRF